MSMFKGMLIKSSERSSKGKNPNVGKGSSSQEAQLMRGSSTLSSKKEDAYLDLEDLAPSYCSSVAATDKGGNHVHGDEAVTLPLHGDKEEDGSFDRSSSLYKIAQSGNTSWCGSYGRDSNNNELVNEAKRSSFSHPNWSYSRNEYSNEPYEGYLECGERERTKRSDGAISPDEEKRHIEDLPEERLNLLHDLLTILSGFFMPNTKQWNKNKMKKILDQLAQNKIHENVLIIMYYFTYEAYAHRVLLNLKEEYNCDFLIHKFLGKVDKIRKKRNKCKEEEKVLIINEKLDTADEMQKQISTYNLELASIENYITDLFRKKKQVNCCNLLMKKYVKNVLRLIIRNICTNKKEEKKKKKKFFEEKRNELSMWKKKITQKEEDIKAEEENIKEKTKTVEESKEELNKAVQVLSSTYENQLQKIDEEIDSLDQNIKELEEIIIIKKSQKEDAIRSKRKLEKEREMEMKTLLQKQSDLNTSMNFIKNTTSLMEEKKKFVADEKEKTKKVIAHLKEVYQSSCQKKAKTNRLLSDLKNVVRKLYNSDEECTQVCEGNSRGKSSVEISYEKTDEKGTSLAPDENTHTTNATETKAQEQVRQHMDASNLLKKIYLLKKYIFEVEKNMNNIKGKKKKLTIDISQFNCEMDNINIKKENLKNKKKILLKNKMLNEIKNTINELEKLDQTEDVILKQLEEAKADLSLLRKDHLRMKEQKEKLKRRLFFQERKLVKQEIRHVRGCLNRDEETEDMVTPPAEVMASVPVGMVDCEVGNVPNGQMGDTVNGQMGDTVNVQMGDMANVQMGDTVNGQMGDTVNGETGDVSNGEMGQPDQEEAFPFSDESEQSEGGESCAAFSQMLNELERISTHGEDEEEEDQNIWSDQGGRSAQEDEDTSQSDEEKGDQGEDGENGRTDGGETPLPSDEEKSGPSEDNSDSGDYGDGVEIVANVVPNEKEEKKINSFPRISTKNRHPLNRLEKLKMEESRIFERMIDKYKSMCNLNESVDHRLLEKELRQIYRDITREGIIFRNKKLLTLRNRRNVLKRYYHYVSDNSEEEDLNG
ncbi:conserved Plasmodium protein, unknown function [Plasmodium knowlesi strain H]|uniref:Uncharacterized protein n=3 Tax=Plasmodium knowlesi TaxID=5850 RepID=A0A5K1VCU4_PLAKH|nr:conserved Plasmodium protein, unknown function [Plasmodium knowlesi strain H]OTN68582.1 Uncharacterized protein PKNOH_S02298400 [Plasmodium knowlesi]CAA9986489.1 conserved Plasmodium protein, unknown function [Plasmodium knowlesi strain H]SBO24255.1 conserved Plasmodium protein, unknown function [Plasmodium knowlesi strain H]SBO29736.1 conserved Plasmodium protein, unknown function [Plasmodium knowlesi strain H]VVS75963.1 conserved Plasmodium protein, unknown function [Plasmodium knowlesi s|eukprot:XP_002261040.1 hypothetical protein, conserved in Plasmodium species [Plasmodium knowlesi strain H]